MWKHPPCQAGSAFGARRSNSIDVVHSLRTLWSGGRPFGRLSRKILRASAARWSEARTSYESEGQRIQGLEVDDPQQCAVRCTAGGMKRDRPASPRNSPHEPEGGRIHVT